MSEWVLVAYYIRCVIISIYNQINQSNYLVIKLILTTASLLGR